MDLIPDKVERSITGASDNVKLAAATASEVLEAVGDMINKIRDGELEIRISIVRKVPGDLPKE